jgi:hypothetical protein
MHERGFTSTTTACPYKYTKTPTLPPLRIQNHSTALWLRLLAPLSLQLQPPLVDWLQLVQHHSVAHTWQRALYPVHAVVALCLPQGSLNSFALIDEALLILNGVVKVSHLHQYTTREDQRNNLDAGSRESKDCII